MSGTFTPSLGGECGAAGPPGQRPRSEGSSGRAGSAGREAVAWKKKKKKNRKSDDKNFVNQGEKRVRKSVNCNRILTKLIHLSLVG